MMGAAHSACQVDSESVGSVSKIGESVGSAITTSFGKIQGELIRQTRSYKQLAHLSYEDFLQNVSELNEISGHFLDSNGKRLVFAVKKGTDTTAVWKGTVRVACLKVDSESKSVDSLRLLNLKQFLAVHRSIQAQTSALSRGEPRGEVEEEVGDEGLGSDHQSSSSQSTPAKDRTDSKEGGKRVHPLLALPAFSHSMILDEALEGTSLDECCVCLERKPDTILPCAHSYCTPCIHQWNVNHKTCPVCREKLESTDDGWVISDGPDSLDIATEIQKSLMEIAHE